MGLRYLTIPATGLLSVAVLSAAFSGSGGTTSSSCATVQGSEVCTWLKVEGAQVIELGATIPLALIEEAPLDAEMVFPPQSLVTVRLPDEARDALGLDHMAVHWEAHGHPPALFLTPHFDFHFYSIPEADVGAINCSDESKPRRLPAGYGLPDIEVPGVGVFIGLCVPGMGMHAMLADDVRKTEAFGASMLIGYYAGKPIFFEPMVSRELLLRKADFQIPMPTVSDLPGGVRYPTAFRAEYDADRASYRLIFSGFLK